MEVDRFSEASAVIGAADFIGDAVGFFGGCVLAERKAIFRRFAMTQNFSNATAREVRAYHALLRIGIALELEPMK